jgi:hypothetical protein
MRGQWGNGMKTASPNKILTGVAGEYFVAAELSRRGYVACLTLRNTRGIDILASNADATKSVGIQVETNSGKRPHWLLTYEAESDTAENLYYVFVNLNSIEVPDYYVVPRAVVAEYVRVSHAHHLATPGRQGQKRNDSTMRTFEDPESKYHNAWHLLGLD